MNNEEPKPIPDLPPLPGQHPSLDAIEEKPQDSTAVKTQPEIVFVKEDSSADEKIDRRNRVIQSIILVVLIGIIILGVIFTLKTLPKIISSISNFSGSLESIFVPKKSNIVTTATSTTSTNNPASSTPAYTAVTSKYTYIAPIVSRSRQNTSTSTSAQRQNNTTAPADLSINILRVDTVAGRTTVRFNVQNVGNVPTGTWSFSANLPSTATPTYYSEPQISLNPQDGVIFTLGFDFSANQSNANKIILKVFSSATEINTSNNVAVYNLY